MSTKLKYGSKPVYCNLRTQSVLSPYEIDSYRYKGKLKLAKHLAKFDSQHEFKVYLELIRMYGVSRVIRQYPLEIIAPGYCYSNGKNWRVDFAVTAMTGRKYIIYFVEAKGLFTTEFGYVLSALEAYDDRAFNKLRIVFASYVPSTNRVVKSLLKSDRQDALFTLNQLKKLKFLP